MKKIMATTSIPEDLLNLWKKEGYEITICDSKDLQERIKATRGCVAAVGRGAEYPREYFEQLPDLKVLALYSAGFEHIDLQAAKDHGVVVCNAGGNSATSVSELTVLLILMAMRNVVHGQNLINNDLVWKSRRMGNELHGKTVVLIGAGNISKAVANLLNNFECKIIMYHPKIEEKDIPDYVCGCNNWDEAFSVADVLSLHIPYRPENDKIVGEHEFEIMKNTAYFINTARGRLVDEQALISALKNGKIRGAGLDVYEHEPTSSDNPLFHLENCACLPHFGGSTEESQYRARKIVVEEILRVLKGEKPLYQVNN